MCATTKLIQLDRLKFKNGIMQLKTTSKLQSSMFIYILFQRITTKHLHEGLSKK